MEHVTYFGLDINFLNGSYLDDRGLTLFLLYLETDALVSCS